MFYGASVWDPWLIIAQIVTVQCLYYLSFGLLLYLLLGEPLLCSYWAQATAGDKCILCGVDNIRFPVVAGPYVTHLSFQHVFDDASMELHSFTGWMVILTNVINSLAAALSLMFVVSLTRVPLSTNSFADCLTED